MNGKQQITGKIILQATLKSSSPFLVGKGEGDEADINAILFKDKPYLPASSFAGCLRSAIEERFDIDNQVQKDYFWGTRDTGSKKSSQSHIMMEDLIPKQDTTLTIRDGVKISHVTGTAETGAKYDYQCVEPGVEFPFKAEITMRNAFDEAFFLQMCHAIKDVMENGLRVGAFTTTGFGRMECRDFSVYHFQFPKDAGTWFEYLNNGVLPAPMPINDQPLFPIKPESNTFRIKAIFNVKSALMVSTYGVDPDEADKKHIESNDQHVLPGKSIKGALRHRAFRILNTIGINNAEEGLKKLMGWIDNENNEASMKSKLYIEEAQIENVKHHIQNRIKIDRFTGGAMTGALFNSEPVWNNGENSLTLTMEIKKYKDWEAGLLLLLLKDLWSEDLPIGGEKNIGRGVLFGVNAEIKTEDQTFHLINNKEGLGLNHEQRKVLEGCVQALVKQETVQTT